MAKRRQRPARRAAATPATTDGASSATDTIDGTDNAGTVDDDDTDDDEGPTNAREYLTAVNKHAGTPATMGDLVSLLEYFGVLPAPDTHAPTPYQG